MADPQSWLATAPTCLVCHLLPLVRVVSSIKGGSSEAEDPNQKPSPMPQQAANIRRLNPELRPGARHIEKRRDPPRLH